MPKNIVVIDDDKSETCNEDLAAAADEKSLERVSLSAESLLKAATSVRGGKNSSLNCSRAEKGVARVVNITSPGHDTPSRSPTTTSVPATAAPRSVKETTTCVYFLESSLAKMKGPFFNGGSLRIHCHPDFERCLVF